MAELTNPEIMINATNTCLLQLLEYTSKEVAKKEASEECEVSIKHVLMNLRILAPHLIPRLAKRLEQRK